MNPSRALRIIRYAIERISADPEHREGIQLLRNVVWKMVRYIRRVERRVERAKDLRHIQSWIVAAEVAADFLVSLTSSERILLRYELCLIDLYLLEEGEVT